jgi:transcriptional regulator with PAS, ATPase and Fis domain
MVKGMTNYWSTSEGSSKYLMLEKTILASLKEESETNEIDLQKIGELLKDDTVIAEDVLERVAEKLENVGRYEEALDLLPNNLLKRADSLDSKLLARLWYRLASLNRWLGNTARAIWCATHSLNIYKELRDTTALGKTHALIGYCYWMIDEYAIAYEHLVAAKDFQEQANEIRALAQTVWNLAIVHHMEGRLEEAREECERGLELLKELEFYTLADHLIIGKLYNTLALVELDEGRSKRAVENCQQAITHWIESKDKSLIALGYANLATGQIDIGEWLQAEDGLLKAKELVQDKNHQTECLILQIFCLLYTRQGKLSEAEIAAKRSIELASKSKLKAAEASGWKVLGDLFLDQGKIKDAISHFRYSLRINSRLGREVELPFLYLRLVEAYLAMFDIDMASEALTKAHERPSVQSQLYFNANVAKLKGKLLIANDEIAEGISYLAKSISLFESMEFPYDAACSHLELGIVMARGRERQAPFHLETALTIFTSLGAELKRSKAEEAINKLRKVYAPKTLAHSMTSEHVVVLERISAAATSHEHLLSELAMLVHQHGRVAVAVFELVANEFKTLISYGFYKQELETARKHLYLYAHTNKTLPANTIVKVLTDTTSENESDCQRVFWLYLTGTEPKFFPGIESLDSIIKVSKMGLEICRLRSLVKAARRTVNRFVTGSHLTVMGMICQSASMQQVLAQIQKVRSSNATILITGESGVGKELVARAIHSTSPRHMRSFIPFNCAAIAPELVESRLFGHTKGAFTGADKDTSGVIRAASGGTLFLDEIGELAISVQPKLLRFLQEREIHAIGDNHPIRVDVRIVAATNRDLTKQVELGLFREDLYHRLNVIKIHIPPLRERVEDISLLARFFLSEASKKENKSVVFSEAALEMLSSYNWPGNVRQLKNEIERAVIMAEPDSVLMPEDFSLDIKKIPSTLNKQPALSIIKPLSEAIEETEQKVISDALIQYDGNISKVARELKISRNGLILKCKRLGLNYKG